MDWIGWISTAALSICGLPLFVEALWLGRSNLNPYFMWLWIIGEVTGLAYSSWIGSLPLIFNYGINSALLAIVATYRHFPR